MTGQDYFAVHIYLGFKQKPFILSSVFILANWAFVISSLTIWSMLTSNLVVLGQTVWPGE